MMKCLRQIFLLRNIFRLVPSRLPVCPLTIKDLFAIFSTSASSGPCRDFTIPAEKVNFSPAANDLPGGRWNIQAQQYILPICRFRMPGPSLGDLPGMLLWHGLRDKAKALRPGQVAARWVHFQVQQNTVF